MRIWDIPVGKLCRQHLLGEHRELHVMWSVIIQNKKGYSKHPETIRWIGKLKALYLRHNQQVNEMKSRGHNHQSLLNVKIAAGKSKRDVYLDTPVR